MVVLTRQRWFETPFSISVDEAFVEAKRSIRYLCLQLEEKLIFGEHIKKTADKANGAVAQLSRIMLNVAGPRYAKRSSGQISWCATNTGANWPQYRGGPPSESPARIARLRRLRSWL